MNGIETCLSLGYRVKINAVALKGVNEEDIVPLARFGREHGIEIRYIEFMPLDSQGIWDRSRVLLADEMIAMITQEIGPLEAVPDQDLRARRRNTASLTAVERSALSRLSASRSASTATAFASLPTVSSVTASLRLTKRT